MLSTLSILVISFLLQVTHSYRMVCIYTNWSQYRPDKGKFLPENVDPSLCTHLIYVYAKLKNNHLEPSEWNDDSTPWMEGMYSRVNSLKQVNPDLKTLLGVGGWMMGSKDFSRMASRKRSRELFARTAVEFLRERDFDGLAVDWQYPTQRGGRKLDRTNFSLLLKEIKEAFERNSKETGLPRLLLVAGVGASKHIVDSAYEADKVSNYTDFLNVMAYDLHGSWDNFTGHPSPLFPRKDETGPQADNNVDTLMKYWVSKGADPSKLVLGVSSYGRTFTLKNNKFNGYGVPVIGPGEAGDYSKQEGMLAYYERCSLYFDATRVWDDYSKVPHWYSGQQWIGGEDVESIREKVNWIYTNKLGGMMIWSMDTDDFDGLFCGNGVFPLIRAAADQFTAPVELERRTDVTNETWVAIEEQTTTSTAISLSLKADGKIGQEKVKTKMQSNALSKTLNKSKQEDFKDQNLQNISPKEQKRTKASAGDGKSDLTGKNKVSTSKKEIKVDNERQIQKTSNLNITDESSVSKQTVGNNTNSKEISGKSATHKNLSSKTVSNGSRTNGKATDKPISKSTRKQSRRIIRRRKLGRRRRPHAKRRQMQNKRKVKTQSKPTSPIDAKNKTSPEKNQSVTADITTKMPYKSNSTRTSNGTKKI